MQSRGNVRVNGGEWCTLNRAEALIDRAIQLLERDTTRRLGCKPNGEGFEELKKQAWFKNFDWDRLEDKELEPPFVPDVSVVFVCCQLTPHQPHVHCFIFSSSDARHLSFMDRVWTGH